MPHPLCFVEKPGSNTRDAKFARHARAVVGDANRARPPAPRATPSNRTRPPRPASASIAFFASTSMAHSSSTASPFTFGRPGSSSCSTTIVLASVGTRAWK